MSTVNPTHIIAEGMREVATEGQKGTPGTRDDGQLWGAFPNTMTLTDLAAHVVSKLTDAGYSIVPSANRAEAHQWDGTRASIETLCRWANDEGDPMDDATLTYTYSRSDDVCDVDFAGPAGYKAVSVGDWIVRMATGEFLLARGEFTAAAAEGEKP